MGHLYYFGTLLAVLFAASVIVLVTARPRREVLGQHVWTVCGVVA